MGQIQRPDSWYQDQPKEMRFVVADSWCYGGRLGQMHGTKMNQKCKIHGPRFMVVWRATGSDSKARFMEFSRANTRTEGPWQA